MRKILIGFLVMSLSLAATANTGIYEARDAKSELIEARYEVCAATSELAKSTMEMRQSVFDIVYMMNGANTDSVRSMVIDAYYQPYHYSQEAKDRAVADFGTKYYLLCIEKYRSDIAI